MSLSHRIRLAWSRISLFQKKEERVEKLDYQASMVCLHFICRIEEEAFIKSPGNYRIPNPTCLADPLHIRVRESDGLHIA